MCYPLREVSQTDGEREKRPGRGQKTVQLHLVRREKKKKKKRTAEMNRDALILWKQPRCQWRRHKKADKADCIKKTIIQLLSPSITITQLDLYLKCTNDSFSFSLFIRPDNHLCLPLISHSPTLLHPVTPFKRPPTPTTVTSPQLFPIGLFGDEDEATGPFDWIMQGNPGETPPTLYVQSKTWVSNFQSCLCVASDKNRVK